MKTVVPRLVFALLLASAMVPASCTAEPQQPPTAADLQRQIDALRAQVAAMQKDLNDIKELLAPLKAQMPSTREDFTLDLGTRPVRGSQAARLILVEFTDYQ